MAARSGVRADPMSGPLGSRGVAEPSADDGFERLRELAVRVGREGAALIREAVGQAVAVGLKSSPTDVVTQTDIDTEAYIHRALLAAVPGSGFIGEEGGSTPSAPDGVTWIVDPLDGTVNFTYGVPLVAVSIAAAVCGRVVAASVVDVFHDEVFSASFGGGAWLGDTRLTGSPCVELAGALVTTGFSYRSDLRRTQGEMVGDLLPTVRDIRCFGSAALEMCWVALGRVDAYYERDTKLWDYAAAALVATEGGAIVELPCPENEGLAIAAPPPFFDALRTAVDVRV